MGRANGGIDAPSTVQQGTPSFEIQVNSGASTVVVTTSRPDGETEYTVGDDGKVTVTVPPGATTNTTILIVDDRIPPNSAGVEIVSSSG